MAMNLRLPDVLDERLGEVARQQNTSKQQIAHEAIRVYVEQQLRLTHRERVRRIAERGARRYADVLRRLGEA